MAKKYIDAEKLRAEIERRIDLICTTEGVVQRDRLQEYETLRDVEDFIDSLQQEQPTNQSMTMKELIRQEIERRMKFHNDAIKACTGLNTISLTHSAGYKEDSELLSFIESLEKENRGNSPKSNTNSQKGIVYQAINEIMGGHTPEKLAECNQTIFKVAMRALEIQQEEHLTKEDIQKVLELALEYYKLEVFGTGKESENPNQERLDWIYDRMKEENK